MPAFVLDASWIPGFFRDEVTTQSPALRDRALPDEVVVPAIWLFEVANTLRQGERKGRPAADESKAAIGLPHRLQPIVEPPRIADALGPILSLARRHTFTVYDASCVEPALPLATCDAALIAAARAEGVDLLRS